MYGKHRRSAFLLLTLFFVICAAGAAAAQEAVDVNIAKTAPDTVVAGDNITYNITVTNTNPDEDAQAVTLVDDVTGKLVDPQYSVDGVDKGSWNGTHIWDVLPAQTSVLVKIWGQVNPSQPAGPWLYNDATVFSANDPNQENNYAHTWTLVYTSADLNITKTAPDTVVAGNNITYDIVVANNGPSDAQAVTLVDNGIGKLINPQFSIDGVDMGSWGGAYGGSYVWDVLPAQTSVLVKIWGQVNPSQPAGPWLYNDATVFSVTDPNQENNYAHTWTWVYTLADVYVQKTAPANVTAGNNITYNIVVGNNGPSDAQNVTVTDTLDSWLSSATYTLDGADMGSWPGSLSLGTLAPGKYVTIIITGLVNATAPAGSLIGNTVSAIADTSDPFMDNNTASTVTGVVTATSGGEGVLPPISGGEAVTEEPLSGGEAVSAETIPMETTGSPVTLLVMALFVLLASLSGIRRS